MPFTIGEFKIVCKPLVLSVLLKYEANFELYIKGAISVVRSPFLAVNVSILMGEPPRGLNLYWYLY